MNYEEVTNLLELVSIHYKNFEVKEKTVYAWLDVLQSYDKNEVEQELKDAMMDKQFQYEPPKAYYLVRNLIKKYDKVDYSKQVVYCPICRRPLNQPDYDKHFDRCSSIEYIISQCKRFDATMSKTKKELFEMSDSDFDKYYNTILRFVQKNTASKSEKERIEFIFNPPSQEKARKFFNKGG